jgi:hypothetical protein
MATKKTIKNLDKLKTFLQSIPKKHVKDVIAAFAEYLLGNDRHGLRHYEPYKYVKRKSAYGVTFFTDKQRRWFWANGGPDMIGNNRTGATAKAWEYKAVKGGMGFELSNATAGGIYTRSDKLQARQPAKVGWRKVSAVIDNNIKGALRHAIAAFNKILKGKK